MTGTSDRGILVHRHTAQFLNDPRLQSLVEQSDVIPHVADHCQYGRRLGVTTGFLCGNTDQRDTERFNGRCHWKRGTFSRRHLPHLNLTCRSPEKVCAHIHFCPNTSVDLNLHFYNTVNMLCLVVHPVTLTCHFLYVVLAWVPFVCFF